MCAKQSHCGAEGQSDLRLLHVAVRNGFVDRRIRFSFNSGLFCGKNAVCARSTNAGRILVWLQARVKS
jgi:hypothetical protein